MTVTVRFSGAELKVSARCYHRSFKDFLLKWRKASATVGDISILDVPYFQASSGDRICVVGRNGNGKTTFLKVLSGIYPLTAGAVWTIANPTAVLAAGIGLEDELSVVENIGLSMLLKSIPNSEISSLKAQILEFCELENDQNKQYKHLSTGFKSRLAFAIAVVQPPRILVLDEVLGGGDEFFMKKANIKLLQTIDKAETAFIATHAPDGFRNICNRLLLMEKGKIKFDGDFDKGLDIYRSVLIES
jgi:ABC-2 type transport system ATP-binding protein/lipopolysaccharide transport system ATP-binding protein